MFILGFTKFNVTNLSKHFQLLTGIITRKIKKNYVNFNGIVNYVNLTLYQLFKKFQHRIHLPFIMDLIEGLVIDNLIFGHGRNEPLRAKLLKVYSKSETF